MRKGNAGWVPDHPEPSLALFQVPKNAELRISRMLLQGRLVRDECLLRATRVVFQRHMNDVTRVLSAIERGDPHAAEQLLPLVYAELRKLAAHRVAREAPGQTLNATALVHEAYLRLVGNEAEPHWNGRGHFFAAAAEAMRRLLIEQARRKRRVRHGGERVRIELEGLDVEEERGTDELLTLDEALQRLTVEEPTAAEVVRLRYFAGLTAVAAAAALGISLRTADRHWAYAKAWLYRHMNEGNGADA
jgi:RNA polymerase sigma factor (TIGR02999 family)